MNFSVTIAGLIIFGVTWVAKQLGVEAPSHESLETTIATVVQVFGLLMAWYGRYRQGDITWYGAKLNHSEPVSVEPAAGSIFKQSFTSAKDLHEKYNDETDQ